ncbi:MAG: thioesterase family protein [Reinekea sp.]|jgi:acyl-CoA thioesterase
MIPIDDLLAGAVDGQPLVVPESWGQGRTAFGGLSAAVLNRVMDNAVADDRHMRVQNTQFIAPLLTNQPFDIQLSHLRDGKNVTQLQASLIQNGQLSVQATAAYGFDRPSKINVAAAPVAIAQTPVKASWLPQIPKVTPKFFRYIDIKFDQGGYPFMGKKTSHYHGWIRFSQPPAQITGAHLIALIDAWPPTVLQQLRLPTPASTLSWNVEFIHPHPPIQGSDWLAYRAETAQASDGYAHTEARIYTGDGTLLALSRQLVTVFG